MKTLRIADLFCGAGGTSTGAVEAIEALGFKADLTAINHWPVAIATHVANHPEARHLTTAVDDVNPLTLFKEGELDLLWASPECTHHSIARGGRPMNDQSRATAWCVIRWAQTLSPAVILIENVPEFLTWGGLGHDGRPMKSKKGKTFTAWVAVLESLGYRVGWKVLCAADYGDPTTRERLFVQAVRGRRKIVWPSPTHGKRVTDTTSSFLPLLPWVPARQIIDWTIPSIRLADRKKPLSDKTMRRIIVGLHKFGLKPFIVPGKNERESQQPRTHSIDRPLPTVTASGHLDLVEPYIVSWDNQSSSNGERSIDSPLSTITTKARHGVVEPYLVELRGTSASQLRQTARSLENPIPAVTAGGGHLGLVSPFLVQVAHGNGADPNGDQRRSRSLEDPIPTVSGSGKYRLCEPVLLPQHSGGVLRSVSEPMPTVATAGAIALVEPYLVPYYGTALGASIDEPLDTVTTKERFGLVIPDVILDGVRHRIDLRFRMLQPNELAAGQGFRKDYQFTGNKTQQVKQIGNAVPRNLVRAIVTAALSQSSNVSWPAEQTS